MPVGVYSTSQTFLRGPIGKSRHDNDGPPFCLHPCLLRSILGKAHLSADNAFLISDCEQCTILRIQLR